LPHPAIFSDFNAIVHASRAGLSPPDPEELPIEDADLAFGDATRILAQMLPESTRRKMKQRQDLMAAGYHSRASWLNLNSVRFVFAFLALATVGVALIAAPPIAEPYLLAAVVAAPLVGWALPPLLVSSKASERRSAIERGLPDALDMLNMGVSQGLTVQSSLRRLGPEISPAHPALAQELKIVNQQAQVGSLSQALQNFGRRMDSAEVTSFTSLLIQSEATGTSVSRALTDYSDSMRSTIRERADSRANAASFKLLFPTVLCLMPSVFMFLLGPAVVSMSEFFDGTANELLEDREDAINSLELGPRIVQPQ
jgi:tight adherence protein C